MKPISNRQGLGALGGAVVVIVVILIIAAAYMFVLPMIPNYSTFGNHTTNHTQTSVAGGLYMGYQWQAVSGGTTPSAVNLLAFPQNNFATYWSKTSASASTQYTSPQQLFNPQNGICVMASSSSAYSYAYCASGSNAQAVTLPGFPSFQDTINPQASCLISSTSTPCINLTPTYPNSYSNGSSSVSAVTISIVPSWSGTTIPSSGSITVNLVGVSARGGGVGMDQGVDTQVLSTGLSGQAMPQYSSTGSISAAPTGSLLAANTEAIVNTNQTQLVFTSMTPAQSRHQVSGAQSYAIDVPPSDIHTSSATASNGLPAYDFISITLPFTYTGPTGKDVAITFSVLDDQVLYNTLNNGIFNSGLTGTTAACTSSTTTNMCMNSTDITVGTAQVNYGTPVVMGGGGAASSTQPSWIPQKATSFPGWATYAPLNTMITTTQVYGT